MEQVLIFANPIAGRGRGRSLASKVHDLLTERGYPVRLFLDKPQTAADEVLRGSGVRAVVSIGGDGTLRAVAARLAQLYAEHPDRFPPLLVVPVGTANLMGRHLDIRWDSERFDKDISAAIARRRTVRLDAGRANGNLFLLMAGVGMDAQIVHELDRLRRGPINLGSYFLPAALALHTYRFPPITVRVNGQVLVEDFAGVVFVGNIPEYGTGFAFLPHARADDQLLDVCTIPCRSGQEALRLFLHAAAGEHLQISGASYTRGRRIEVTSPAKVPVQVDGEPAGYTPVEIDLLPFRIPFIVRDPTSAT